MPLAPPDTRVLRRRPGSRSHTLLCGGTEDVHTGTAAWVRHELVGGSKVLYKGWLADDRLDAGHWLHGPVVDAALDRGQLTVLGFATVVDRCGGTTEGLARLQAREVRDALHDGWPTVAMVQETTGRALADEAEIAEFARQERGYDRLARLWPLNTLCQLDLDAERPVAVRESVAVHHDDVVAPSWSGATVAGRWHLAGELDLAGRDQLRAALRGVLVAHANRDVHLDLARVTFLDSACAEVFVDAARATVPRRRFVLHGTPALAAEMLRLVGISPEATVLGASP